MTENFLVEAEKQEAEKAARTGEEYYPCASQLT
jgi:hypothetical protein